LKIDHNIAETYRNASPCVKLRTFSVTSYNGRRETTDSGRGAALHMHVGRSVLFYFGTPTIYISKLGSNLKFGLPEIGVNPNFELPEISVNPNFELPEISLG
jgi:hypothetical protein